MSVVKVDVEKLVEFIKNELNIDQLQESVKALKAGWDWNPFDKDGDEYVTAWQEFQHNIELLGKFLEDVMYAIEKAARALGILEGGAKLEAAVKFADEIVKLPFFLEWLDDNLFRLVFSLLVQKTNEKYGHDWSTTGKI